MVIAIISDIHEDYVSLVKAFQVIEKHNPDMVVCLGDIAGFSIPAFNYFSTRNASASLGLIRQFCRYIICGNHDLYAIRKLPHHHDFFKFPENWYELDFSLRKKLAAGKVWIYEDNELSALLSNEEKNFVSSLPEFEFIKEYNLNILLSHAPFPDPTGSSTFFPSHFHELKPHFEFMKKKQSMISFFGHGHVQGVELFHNKQCDFLTFGEYPIDSYPCCVSCPAIAKSSNRSSGFVIYDSDLLLLKVIELA